MQSVNKIHSTRISLNDRFTIIQTVQPKAAAGAAALTATPRRRRSQSANSRTRTSPKSSLQNRRLLEQLDQKHMMRTALRLKKKSLRSNLPLRQRMNAQMKNRILKRGLAPTTLSVGPGGRLKRANSLRNIGTMQADLVGNGRLRRSNSALNLAGRLGVRGQVSGANSRRRLIRNNVATQRSRSRSRQNNPLIRSNSQTNLRRTNSKQSLATLKRSNSQVRGRSASRQRPRLQRSNSRSNLNNGLRNRNNAAVTNRRIGSINGRLGVKRTQLAQTRNVQRGRVMKRRNSNVNGNNGNVVGVIGRNGARQRVARSRTRVAQPNLRNRSASRGRNGRQQNNGNNFVRNNQQSQPNNRSRQNVGRGRAGRSRSRGRPGRPNAGAAKNKQPIKTKEELDKELDQYMVNTKNNEIDIFMG